MKKSWNSAKYQCETLDIAQLGSIVDIFEQSYTHLLSYSGDAWIGLIQQADKKWGWTDGRQATFTNWAGSINQFNSSLCVYIQASDGKWNFAPCTEQKPFMCKFSTDPIPIIIKPPPGYCANPGWEEYGRKCYKAEKFNLKSYPEAKFDCTQEGSKIVYCSFFY